jgi:hypothetical protein
MKCERCFRGEEVKYRVHTEVIDLKVCAACARKARKLRIAVDGLIEERKKSNQGKRSLESWAVG